jgi:flagellar motor switch protein FliN/FliY
MADEVLSQEDIEALIAQTGEDTSTESSPNTMENAAAGHTGVQENSKKAPSEASVKPMEFAPVGAGLIGTTRSGVDLILDVELNVTVELGRATMQVRDVLALGPGSVVELDTLAGEPVSVVVNNKTIARGEIVVIDENFGVRITEIVDGGERRACAKAA